MLWWNCGCRDMVALKLLRPTDFDTPYAYCTKEVVYVLHLHSLIRMIKTGALHRIKRALSLHWVLFDRDMHLVARSKIFDRDNNFTFLVRAKGLLYVAWSDFTLYFGMTYVE